MSSPQCSALRAVFFSGGSQNAVLLAALISPSGCRLTSIPVFLRATKSVDHCVIAVDVTEQTLDRK